jgi:hypothetical protein
MKYVTLLALLIFQTAALAFPLAPNPNETTGDLCTRKNPDFKEYRYGEHIPYCNRNVSGGTKSAIYREYGIPAKCKSRYTIDHFIPLSLGGSNEPSNLWPEHKNVKATRPDLEMELYVALRNGEITQQEAIDQIIQQKMNPPPVHSGGSSKADCDVPDSL